jgi:hypothetical protein
VWDKDGPGHGVWQKQGVLWGVLWAFSSGYGDLQAAVAAKFPNAGGCRVVCGI